MTLGLSQCEPRVDAGGVGVQGGEAPAVVDLGPAMGEEARLRSLGAQRGRHMAQP